MAGKVYQALKGFTGAISRSVDDIVEAFVNAESATAINFGDPVVFDATTGGVKKVASTSTGVLGVAVRTLKTEETYGGNDPKYKPGELVDVLKRGSIIINVGSTLTPAAGGVVYITKATGAWATAADSTNTIDTGWKFKGTKDANNNVEIVIPERNY